MVMKIRWSPGFSRFASVR